MRTKRRARSLALALALGAVPFAILIARFDFVCDDAFIAYRYAQNLVEGHGLRYNLGVDPPVEGYTSLGWVLVMALVELAGADPVLWSRVLGIACGAGLMVYVTAFAQRRLGLGLTGTIATVLTFSTLPAVAVWSTGGLETMAFTLLLFATFERMLGNPERPHGVQAGLLGGLTGLMRADGAFWLLVISVLSLASGARRRSLRPVLCFAAWTAVIIGLHVAWRLWTYEDFLPNTARAKLGLSALTLERGAKYLAEFLLTFPALAGILLLGAWHSRRSRAQVVGHSVVLAAATFAYGVIVGGDFMAFGRFFVPATPFLALAAGAVLDRLEGVRGGRALTAGALALITGLGLAPAWNVHVVPESWRARLHFNWNLPNYTSEYETWVTMRDNVRSWILLGKGLALHTKPEESLVRGPIGAVGYYSRLFIYDLHGLVTREVTQTDPPPGRRRSPGHDRTVAAEFFAPLCPTYLHSNVITTALAAERRRENRPDLLLFSLPQGQDFPPGLVLALIRSPLGCARH